MYPDRIGFLDPDQRTLFFELSKASLDCKSWKELYRKFGVVKSNFEFYRNGNLLIPEWLFSSLLNSLSSEQKRIFCKCTYSKPANWGLVLGGQRNFSLHPELAEKGRLCARQSMQRRANAFDVCQPITPGLCEFIGAFLGDGYSNRNGRHFTIGFAGHAKLDSDYYRGTVIPIAKKLFNILHCSVWKKDNRMQVKFHSKCLYELLTQRFGIPTGVKFNKILIPQEILASSRENISAVLRGMFDTDGCVFFDRRKTYKAPYLRICLTMKNPPILNQVVEQLGKFGISGHLSRGRDVHIISRGDIDRFLHVVGFSNRKHIDKVIKTYSDFESYNPGKWLLLTPSD